MEHQTTSANQAALSAYGASKRLNQNPQDLLVAVHDELYRAAVSAKSAHEQNALDQMCLHAQRCHQILQVLAGAMDFSVAGADGLRLQRFYKNLAATLNRATNSRNVTDSYQQMLDTLQPFCRELRLASRL